MTVLGTSPRFLSELQARNVDPLSVVSHSASFTALREIVVTGAVLTAQLMTWSQKAFGGNLHIGSSSGGTDVFCCCKPPSPYLAIATNTVLHNYIVVTPVFSFPLYAGGEALPLSGPSLLTILGNRASRAIPRHGSLRLFPVWSTHLCQFLHTRRTCHHPPTSVYSIVFPERYSYTRQIPFGLFPLFPTCPRWYPSVAAW